MCSLMAPNGDSYRLVTMSGRSVPSPRVTARDTGWCHTATGIEGWVRRGEADISSIVSRTDADSLLATQILSWNVFQKKRKGFHLFEICCCVWVSVLSLTISARRAKNSDNYVSIEMLSLSSNKVLTTVNALLADIRYLHCPPLSLCNCILFICCAVLPWWPLPLTWLNHPRNEDLKQHSLTHLVQIVTGLV